MGRRKHAEVVFIIIPGAGPIVQICLLHAIPVTGALSVLEQCIGHAVSPCLSRNIGAMNRSEAIGLKLERGLGQRVVRLEILGVKGGERNGEAHILGENLLGILVGDHPLDEILSGLLVLVGSLLSFGKPM